MASASRRGGLPWGPSAGASLGLVGASLLAGFLCLALAAPQVAPYDPAAQVAQPFAPPSRYHLLGANDLGQDLLSELLYGSRVSFAIGALSATAAGVLGTAVGLASGYFGGVADIVLMRVVDLTLGLPLLPLVIVLAVFLGPGLFTEILVIGGVIWARPARELRSLVLSLRERGHVEAARALGGTGRHIAVRHVLPGMAPLTIPQFVRAARSAILLEASLSFLGLGDPVAKSWGTTLFYANARGAFLTEAWLWWVLPTGLCIAGVVIGFAFIGYWLEERLTPRLRMAGPRAHGLRRLRRGPVTLWAVVGADPWIGSRPIKGTPPLASGLEETADG